MILKNEINQNSLQLIESSFEKQKLKPGILHIGVGNFHRSHQAYLIDKFIEKNSEFNWGIIGLNLISNSSNIINNLKKRDGNYILKTISSNGDVKYKNIKSIIELSDWSTEKENSEKILNNENIHLITITVTETGYFLNEKSELDENNKLIKDELNNKMSNSIYAYLRIALNNRKKSTNKPITILCCDNLRENGKILKNCFIKYLELINDKELINWLSKNVTFPSCVVDRITPRTPENLAEEIEQNFNIKEDCSVLSEDFIQWVIEEDFAAPFPALDQLDNVYFTSNVINFEETKIRVLNGGHSCLAYFGALKELNTFDQCFKEKFLDNFFKELENEEILPALGNMETAIDLFEETSTSLNLIPKFNSFLSENSHNITESQSVDHHQLRSKNQSFFSNEKNRLIEFIDHFHKTNTTITDVVQIGIGGSYLGPRLIHETLSFVTNTRYLTAHFITNIDPLEFDYITQKINPKTTSVGKSD